MKNTKQLFRLQPNKSTSQVRTLSPTKPSTTKTNQTEEAVRNHRLFRICGTGFGLASPV